jgi:hypothetical protein
LILKALESRKMSNFSSRWGLPSSRQEDNIHRHRGWRHGCGASCRARLEGWIRNVAARSPIWGDVDLAAFCRTTGYSREHATRELAGIRRDNPELAFETKLRRKKGQHRKRWGVIVAERRKLCFDERSLFYDASGRLLHNYTTLARDGEKIVPTVKMTEAARKPRGRPPRPPRVMDALMDEWHKFTGTQGPPVESGCSDSVRVNSSDKASVSNPDNRSDGNSELCDSPYKEKDSFGIQQKDLYGAGRDVAQWRGWEGASGRRPGQSRLRRKAFVLLRSLAGAHWDNCKVSFSRSTAYRYALLALIDGHDERRILARYSDALFVCHGLAVDRGASAGKVEFFNLSSTVTKARQLLAKDGLTRRERIGQWYQNKPRSDSRGTQEEFTPADLALARQQIAASLGVLAPFGNI